MQQQCEAENYHLPDDEEQDEVIIPPADFDADEEVAIANRAMDESAPCNE